MTKKTDLHLKIEILGKVIKKAHGHYKKGLQAKDAEQAEEILKQKMEFLK